MANPPNFNSTQPIFNIGNWPGNTRGLFLTYKEALREAATLHTPGFKAPRPGNIVFPLMGSGAVGHGYDNSARAAMHAIREFFNVHPNPVTLAHYRAQITKVTFVVPANESMSPHLSIAALQKALR